MDNEQKLLQLLENIEKANRKQLIYTRAQAVSSVISAALCIALLFIGIKVLPQLQETIEQAQSVLSNLESVTDELAKSDLNALAKSIGSLVENVDGLVHITENGVVDAVGKINDIDFDALNDAISDLSAVVEPVAKFFKTFKFG